MLVDSPTADRVAAGLDRALRVRSPLVARLSYANTSVRFVIEDSGEAATLLLDQTPARLAGAGEPAEAEIVLARSQAEQFVRGQLPMTAAIVEGLVKSTGPIRRYLEVDPILRGLLSQACDLPPIDPDAAACRAGLGPSAPIPDDLLAIQTRRLRKAFGPQQVLKGASLRIPEGVISVVLGPSGTGKSVLLQHIIGLLKPDAGDVLVRGRPLGAMSRSQIIALRTEIGVMFQDGALFSAMNVYDNVAFPLRQHTDLNEHEIRVAVEQRLDAVGLRGAAGAMPASLSGGMRKRAGLARALVLEPSIVLCDEPDSGLDPVRTALLADLLRNQHAETGGTMVVITHNIALTNRIADHISVVWQGEVLASGMRAEIMGSDEPFIRQFLAGESIGPLGMDA